MKILHECEKKKDQVYFEHEEWIKSGDKYQPNITARGKALYCYNEDECLEAGVKGCIFANKEGINPAKKTVNSEKGGI